MAVVSVTEDQQPDQIGNLVDVYVITFTIADKPGTFTVTVPQSGDPVAAASSAISALTGQVEGIYGL
jgi:hypothetical protein